MEWNGKEMNGIERIEKKNKTKGGMDGWEWRE
jgi:hypothetical protein